MSDINLTDQVKQDEQPGLQQPRIDADRVGRPTVGEQLERSFGSGATQTRKRQPEQRESNAQLPQPPLPPRTARQPLFEPAEPTEPKPAGDLDGFVADSELPIVYSERRVIDTNGNSLGRVRDVLFEGTDAKPTWLVVKKSPFRAARYVPVRGSYATVTDKLVVPFDQRTITSSPKATGTHVLTSNERALLAQHYGLGAD